jgi:hypothetical protein
MSASDRNGLPNYDPVEGASELENRLRRFFAEQRRLREQLEQTRADLDRVNSELLQFQDEYCTDAAREEEYLDCLERVLGYSVRIDLKELEEARNNPRTIEDIIAEIENAEKA